MKTNQRWYKHLGRLLTGTVVVGIVAWLSGYWLEVVLLASVIYLAWQLVNLYRLHRWIESGSRTPLSSFGIWSDVNGALKKLQQKNQTQKRKLKALIKEFELATSAHPDASVVINKHHQINWFNKAAGQWLGLQNPVDRGQLITNLIRDPGFFRWLSIQDRVESAHTLTSPANQNQTLSVRAVNYRSNQILLVFKDVTEIQRQERIRNDFVANVSHELRTPLTVLMGYLEVMRQDSPAEYEQALMRMQEQAINMQGMLQDLIELSRLQSDQVLEFDQHIDVPAMLKRLHKQALEISNGKHRFIFEIQPEICLLGIERDIQSAFHNLINNAIRYSPDGGEIRLIWREQDGGLEFSVTDEGIGIPAKDLPRITERFYRVGSDRAGGTGLGLAIVKHVLNNHQGRLNIDSELGFGSRFSCYFPLSRKRIGSQPENASSVA